MEPKTFPYYARQFMDYDPEFLKKLKKEDPEAAKWLSQFNDEWYGNRIKRYGDKAFHKTQEEKREIYRQTNRRNFDIYSKGGRISMDLFPHEETTYDPSDDILDLIDKKTKLEPEEDEN